jgi:hypothetical protein
MYSHRVARTHTQTWNAGLGTAYRAEILKGEEECFDRELWREKKYVFGLMKTVYSQKDSSNNIHNKVL